jgi:hypothetical protein
MPFALLPAAATKDPLATWAPVLGALIAVTGVLITLSQKWRNDRRDAWWKRTQWALDKLIEPDASESTKAIGLIALTYLVATPLATDSDRRMLSDIADEILHWSQRP